MNDYFGKKSRLFVVLILAALLLLVNSPPFLMRRPQDVNVILLTVDSLRPDHLGCYGYRRNTSPNIDMLAQKGHLFRRVFAQSAWTIPGIMSILTSLQPPVHQIEERGRLLDTDITTVIDCFRKEGYVVPNICFLFTLPEFSTMGIGPVEERYFAEDDSDELLRWLDENHDSKFFIFYHYRDLHLPYKPKDVSHSLFLSEIKEEGQLSPGVRAVLSDAATIPVGTVRFEPTDRPFIIDLYDAEVRELDSFVGRLYTRLRRYGLLSNTLIVITSDHGEELLDHGFVGHASTTHSATLFDEIIYIPLIISMPGYLPGGFETGEQVQQVDIMPTVLGIVGLPVPAGVQGRSLAPLLLDHQQQHHASLPVFAETVYGGFQATEEMAKTRLRCIRTDSWKLIETESPEGKTYQLYDLLLDPREFQDVSAENPQTASMLLTLLEEWQRENRVRKNSISARASASVTGALQASCPEIIFPYDGAVLRYGERKGMVRSSWTGSPDTTYIIEYEIGKGVHYLTGSFITYGNRRDFGPYSREIWNALAVRNPWHCRISPDTHPRCWSEWIQFTFE